ncbi:MAG TPA: hypothetical protein VME47_20235 [Acetobacteraceae bacterium]|nr:hypothetical protein [Acetobacteraceae bacterium]
MGDCYFYASLAVVYAGMAFEAWQLRHRRLASGYALLACLSLGFAAIHLPHVAEGTTPLWT